jgi:hypothetical protein
MPGNFKIFRSAISYGILIPLALIILVMLFIVLYHHEWVGIGAICFTLIIILPIYLQTYYTITADDKLKVKCGFLINITIDINTIKKIKKSKNPFSAPALSLNRIEIFYGKYDSVLISPKNRGEFAESLKQINPNIDLDV